MTIPLREGWEVSPRQVKTMLDAREDLMLLDCRTPREFDVARIDGATLIPLHELPARHEEIAERRDRPVIVYCHHGMRSLQVTGYLRQQGFTNVHSMAGGIDRWSVDVEPNVPRY